MARVLTESFSSAQHYLAELRDVRIQQDRLRFRSNLRRLGFIMAYEISRTLSHVPVNVNSPLGVAQHERATPPVLIAILRAALPFLEGFQDCFDHSDTGFIGAYRKAHAEKGRDIEVAMDYLAIPDLEGKDVILIDPMLATGTSLLDAVQLLNSRFKLKSLKLATLIAAPEGIRHIETSLGNSAELWTFHVDSGLNASAYILPGLGDAGDLCFGEKK